MEFVDFEGDTTTYSDSREVISAWFVSFSFDVSTWVSAVVNDSGTSSGDVSWRGRSSVSFERCSGVSAASDDVEVVTSLRHTSSAFSIKASAGLSFESGVKEVSLR